ncbi:MAG: hypothetical protein LBJ84_05560 [Oscillospiraceae bacterium]|jgi:membrane protein implicated in regulation of membrane protease activity|nr:hypothetical protein [Oscillospiraceae bacterium]
MGIEWTAGAAMFYGGLAGAAATIVAAAIAAVLLARGKRRLRERLNDEYGAPTRREERTRR